MERRAIGELRRRFLLGATVFFFAVAATGYYLLFLRTPPAQDATKRIELLTIRVETLETQRVIDGKRMEELEQGVRSLKQIRGLGQAKKSKRNKNAP